MKPAFHSFRRALITLVVLSVPGCARHPEPGAPRVIRDSELPVASLAHGVEQTISLAEAGHVLVTISQDNVDVQLQLTGPDGSATKVDAPARRAAPERACWFSEPGAVRLKITTDDRVAESHKNFRLQVSAIAGTREVAPGSALEAECLESRAALTSGNAPDYQSAANIWTARGEFERAAFAHLQAAWALARSTQTLPALEEGQKARSEFRQLNDAVGEALANLQLAVPRSELITDGKDETGKPTDDVQPMLTARRIELESALATFESAGMPFFAADASLLLGSNYYQQGDLGGAARLFAKAADNFTAYGEAEGATRALSNSAIVLSQAGHYRDAAESFSRLLADKKRPASDAVLGDILDNSAATHSAAGHYDRALIEFLRALRIHETQQPADIPGQIRSLNGIADNYMRMGDARAALAHLARSRELIEARRKTPGHENETVQVTRLLLAGEAHRALGELGAAKTSHEEALKVAGTKVMRVQAMLALARDALAAGEPPVASSYIAGARKLVQPDWGTLLLQLKLEHARAQLNAGRLLDASNEFAALLGKFDAAGGPEFELETLQGLAQAQFQRKRFDDALATNERGIARLKALRLASGNSELRARLNAVYRAAYELRVDLLVAKRKVERSPTQRALLLAEMFAAADEARSGLARATSLVRSLSPHSASSERRSIAGDIALRQYVLSMLELESATSAQATQVRTELASLRARFDALSSEEAASLPEFGIRDYGVEGIRDDFAVLVFLRSSALIHRYLLTRDGIEELEALPSARVTDEVKRALAELTEGKSNRDSYPAINALSATLLPRIEALSRQKHLIVVADNVTAGFPFGALNVGEGYVPLVTTHQVSMALTLRDALRIAQTSDEKMRVNLSLVAVFSDPVFTALDTRVKNTQGTRVIGIPPLRLAATADESAQIATLLPKAVRQYSGFEATRKKLLSKKVNQATVLHLATHAVASDQWPNGSGLLLTGSAIDGTPLNGYVSTLDLLSRRAVTDLVVLSACDTTRGESTEAENVAGLARAFLGGGARRVIAAHWKVDDAATALLMREFYSRLVAGETAAEALSNAQRKLLATPLMRGQVNWAAFVIYESSPVD